MFYIRVALIGLAITFVSPSLASIPGESGPANFSRAYCSNCYVLAQYITREEQQRRAQENLQRHREQQQERSNTSVDRSTNTYGREWQEQQLQGEKPRVVRPW